MKINPNKPTAKKVKRSKTKLFYAFAFSLLFHTFHAQQTSLAWAKQIGSSNNELGISIAKDANGNIYTTGVYEGTVDFDPGTGTSYMTSAGSSDIFISKSDASGNFIWAKSMGGTNSEQPYSICLDGSGNILTTGYFIGTADFDPGTGTSNLTSTYQNIFVSKLDASGNFVWAKQFSGSGPGFSDGWGSCITVDGSGNVYSAGLFSGTKDFDPGAGVSLLSSTGFKTYVSKLDASGNFVWAKAMGGISNGANITIDLDASGNVYVNGTFDGTRDFDPGVGVSNLSSFGNYDAFITKLDGSGAFVWVKQFGGSGYDIAGAIHVDGSGNLCSAGSFQGTADFDPGTGTSNLISAGNSDIYVLKIDASGSFIWSKQMGGTGADSPFSITTDASGNIYTTGYFENTADLDPGTGTNNISAVGNLDAFLSKLDASGSFVWGKGFGGSAYELGNCLVLDGSGNIYTIGYFQGTSDFDPESGTTNLTSLGNWDCFIQKISQVQAPVTRLSTGSCGITETTLADALYCDYVPGATDYKYEITDPNNNVVIVNRGSSYTDFYMYMMAGVGYGRTYSIRVSAYVSGSWTAYGVACNVTTPNSPTTKLSTGSCGITESSLSDALISDYIYGATDYKYEITDANNNVVVVNRGSSYTDFYMYMMAGIGYGRTYSIRVAAAVGGTWTAYGVACNVTTPNSPTTKLSTGSCGITESSLSDALVSDYIYGATDYKYEITDANNNVVVVNRGSSYTDFYMYMMAGIGYGRTYSIRVAAAVGGTWTAYGVACNVTTPNSPTTKLSTASCGITESTLADALICDFIYGATDYRYEITDANNNVAVVNRGSSYTDFYMYMMSGVAYGQTYSIRVAAAVGGTWTAYGVPCNVTTPNPVTTKLSTTSCGITETSLSDALYCDYVFGATDYKYEITDANSNVVVVNRGNSYTDFYMYMMAGVGYGRTYSIRVSAYVGGTWTSYGIACNVTTPNSPTTKLSTGSCGITETSLSDALYCDYIYGATDYKYEITDANSNVVVVNRGNSYTDFYMYMMSGIGYGRTYSIRVSAAVGGTWTAYGLACNVTTPNSPATQLSTGSCGITETSLSDALYCDYVYGATDYKYEITDANSNVVVVNRGNSYTDFYMYMMAGIGYGRTYSIRVSAAVGGTWTAYGVACNVTTPNSPTTKLTTASCGITESSLSDALYCDYIYGATDYKYEITDANNNVVIVNRGNSYTDFYMYMMSGVTYAQTYSVRVAAAVGGTWTAYGLACNVTTPAGPKAAHEETGELNPTGISENKAFESASLKAYPNPTEGKVSIELGKTYSGVIVSITNEIGEVLRINTFESTDIINLSIEEPKGIYFINIRSEQEVFRNLKIVKL